MGSLLSPSNGPCTASLQRINIQTRLPSTKNLTCTAEQNQHPFLILQLRRFVGRRGPHAEVAAVTQ